MQLEFVVPNKSPNDQRQYQAFQLPNNLKLLLISDPKAQKAACSVSVGVGSLRDGQRSLGLAHFLQHMLFMGSRKFPRHNQYSEFMSLNSGSDNAYTADDQTNYHFEIANSHFQEAVERLCDFFVKALLTDSCIEKERQAVHEQCMLRFGEDNSRKWQILKHFANGPYHNHSIGNNNTLNHIAVSQDLNNFYNNEYSANRISAVLLSALPLDEVREKVTEFFGEIQNKKLSAIEYVPHFLTQNIGKMVQMQSIKDQVIMEFFFAVQSTRKYYQWHPEKYITHVLGHQGKNSLLSFLKQNDWASKIVSYSHDLPKQTIFGLEIQLTEKGENESEDVYNLVINYIQNLKAERHIYEQLKQASAISFRFKEKGSNINYVTELSGYMHRIPLPEILSFKYTYAEFNQEVINGFIRQLTPANLIIVYSNSQELKNPITQKHLGGKFIIKNLPNYSKLQTNFLPLIKNPFLPLQTEIIKGDVSLPINQKDIWFVQGDFGVCKGGIKIIVHKSQSEIFLEFYSSYLDLLLKEITYEAETLRLQVQIESEDYFSISIYGFSHTVQKLLQEIAPLIRKEHHSQHGERLFNLSLQDLKQQYQNFYEGQVDQIVDQLLQVILKSRGTSIDERIDELETYDYAKISNRIDQFWKAARLQWVVVGNFKKEEVVSLIQNFEKVVGTCSDGPPVQNKCIKLQKNDQSKYLTQLQSEDIGTSGVIVYKEIGDYTQLKFYTLSLLKNYIQQPFFDQLRTQKQLAYYLRAYQQNVRGILSLCYLLISSNSDPYEISNHIKIFVEEFLSKIEEDLTNEKFQSLKKSLISKILEPFNSLNDYFEFICRQIKRGTFCFDRKTNAQQLKQYIDQIKREDVINMLKESLYYSLQVWVVAQPHKKVFQKRKIKGFSVDQIKKNHEFYNDITIEKRNAKPLEHK